MPRQGRHSNATSENGVSPGEHLTRILRRLEVEVQPSAREKLLRTFLLEEARCLSLPQRAAVIQSFADEYAQKLERQLAISAAGGAQNGARFELLERIAELDTFLRGRAAVLTNRLNDIA